MRSKNLFLKFILVAGDIILIGTALTLALALRYGDFSFLFGSQARVFLFNFSFISLFWLIFLYLLDFYEIPPLKRIFDFFRNLLIFLFLAGLAGIVYFYFQPEIIISPKTILFLHVLLFSLFLCSWRYLFSFVLRLQNFREKVALIGLPPGLEELADSRLLEKSGYQISVFFNPNPSFLKNFSTLAGLAKHGIVLEIDKLKKIIKQEGISLVVFPRFFSEEEKIIEQIFLHLPLNLHYLSFADFYENVTSKVALEAINKTWFLENFSQPEKKAAEAIKRIFDVFFSLLGLLVIAILFPLIGLAIKLDSKGPIFYSQTRVGQGGKVFTIFKFRTMKAAAEKNGPQWARPADPRITRAGKILRKLYLDEFPQFYNILKGDLSFVGPRPERPEFVEKLKKEIPYYEIRHLIKPGFTGWAQLNYRYGASVEDAKEKLRYDFYYIKNRNFFLDLGIIFKTFRLILSQ